MALDDQPAADDPRGRRWPPRWPAIVEIAVVAAALAMAATTYLVLHHNSDTQQLLSPGVAALLLLGDLIPVVGIIIMIGRRIARRRSARLSGMGGGKLHVRLVAIFSLLASVPIVLTVIAASIMFQSVNRFWASNRAANAFDATISLVEDAQYQFIQRWTGQARLMASDIGKNRELYPIGTKVGHQYFLSEIYLRSLNQAVLFTYAGSNGINVLDVWSAPDDKTFFSRVTPDLLKTLRKDEKPFINYTPDTVWVVTRVPEVKDLYLYVGTGEDASFLNRQHMAASDVLRDFKALQGHSHALQLRFNAALFGVAALIVALTTWIALVVADRVVRPVNQLADAARRVAEGDLAVRVPEPTADDEVATLGTAFNTMTQRLEAQTTALENRRALIEAVMSGVTAGVISIDAGRTIQLVNSSAVVLLNTAEGDPVGRPLKAVAPELDALLDEGQHEAIVQISDGEPKTLAVKITGDAEGQVLTFDDITQQLLDQRRAAWSDVARRIAHEIKNPLTPIQLAAERLQRRYGKQFDGQDATFNRLTDTIVRQVGDLRRMVDEFSSFARMPKPVFREESLVDIGRQALFLHEVAHPHVAFRLDYDEPPPMLVCDRRQIGQALTNIVKNAVEAIEAKGDDARGEIAMTLTEDDGATTITVADDGVGLPSERARLVEPYMTTRARGTGLGLAIVKKIAEEHFGEITFADRPGGGTVVTMRFDARTLAALDISGAHPEASGDDAPLPALTRNRNS
jgi:two-component system nitrogen regulation sensor histidine kinase NtrY